MSDLDGLNKEINPPPKTGDLYGLGALGSVTVNPGSLPLPIFNALQGTAGNPTADSVVAAFDKLAKHESATHPSSQTSQAIATIQRALLLGGYYGTNSTYTPTYGVIAPQDVKAFTAVVKQSAQSGTSVTNLMLAQAKYGQLAGVAAASQAQAAKSGTATVELPNTQDLEAVAMKAFEATLGRGATPKEQAAFAAQYRALSGAQQRANNQAVFDAKAGATPSLTPSQAASQDQQIAAVGAPVTPPLSSANTIAPGSNQFVNPTLLQSQQTAATTSPSFEQQMMSLGDVAQQAQADMTPSTAGLTQTNTEQVESPETAAENYAENTDPKAARATGLANTFHDFLSIIGSQFGGA